MARLTVATSCSVLSNGSWTRSRTIDARDLAGEALLAVAVEDLREVALAPLVDDRRGRHLVARIHAHVERRVVHVAEAAGGSVDLHRRHAEIHQHRAGLRALVDQAAEAGRERPVHRADRDAGADRGAQGIDERLRRGVAIDRDQLTAAVEVACEHAGVAAGAEGAVDDQLTGVHVEQRADLARQHRYVRVRAWTGQDVRQHSPRSLRPRRAGGARPRGPRSRAGHADRR